MLWLNSWIWIKRFLDKACYIGGSASQHSLKAHAQIDSFGFERGSCFVEVERAIDLDLQGFAARVFVGVSFDEMRALIGVVDGDGEAFSFEGVLDALPPSVRAAVASAVAEHDIRAAASDGGGGHRVRVQMKDATELSLQAVVELFERAVIGLPVVFFSCAHFCA